MDNPEHTDDWGDWDDGEYEFADRDPTVDECLRFWHHGIEWHQHETLFGIRDLAGVMSEAKESRRTWIESVQRTRAAGLFDTDTAYNILYSIVDASLDYQEYSDDPKLGDLCDRIQALCRSYRLPENEDFTRWPNPPAEWTALLREFDEREAEMRREVLLGSGEYEMVRLMTDQPDEFRRRMAVVDERLEHDHDSAMRWMRENSGLTG